MASSLGKRKRRDHDTQADGVLVQPPNDEATAALQAFFRRHFEEAFEPLEDDNVILTNANIDEDEVYSDGDESDWGGLSGEDEETTQVVVHSKSEALKVDVSRDELKTFMVSITRSTF